MLRILVCRRRQIIGSWWGGLLTNQSQISNIQGMASPTRMGVQEGWWRSILGCVCMLYCVRIAAPLPYHLVDVRTLCKKKTSNTFNHNEDDDCRGACVASLEWNSGVECIGIRCSNREPLRDISWFIGIFRSSGTISHD